MKNIFLGLFILATFTTHASREKGISLETLGALFDEGERPDVEEISNSLWSGRCFYPDRPSKPRNAGFVFKQESDGKFKAVVFTAQGVRASRFDNLKENEVYNLANYPLDYSEAHLKSTHVEFNSDSLKRQLKVSGQYLIVDMIKISTASTYGRCYFFIPYRNIN